MMTEITKSMKIILLINIIIEYIIAFLYLVIPFYFLSLLQWPFFDPYYSWAFGGVWLIQGTFLLFYLKKNHWEKCKTVFEIVIAWYILILILNSLIGIIATPSVIALIIIWIFNVVFIILSGLNIYFYRKI